MGVFRDLAGERFGRLTVVSFSGKTASGNYKWQCSCDCGASKTLPSDHLVRKAQPVISCGCYRDDRIRETCSPDPDAVAFRLLLGTYKKRSRIKKIAFDLTDEEFSRITSSDCRYCGAAPSLVMMNKPGTGRYIYNSIDRKDPKRGYVADNVTACCKPCNYMKWTLSESEFIARATAIARKAGGQ
jgi:hypothetical protein